MGWGIKNFFAEPSKNLSTTPSTKSWCDKSETQNVLRLLSVRLKQADEVICLRLDDIYTLCGRSHVQRSNWHVKIIQDYFLACWHAYKRMMLAGPLLYRNLWYIVTINFHDALSPKYSHRSWNVPGMNLSAWLTKIFHTVLKLNRWRLELNPITD